MNTVFLLLDWLPMPWGKNKVYNITIAEERIIGFITFPSVLTLSTRITITLQMPLTQSAGAVEYTDCTSAEG